jgi:hypothetical protein
LQSSVGIQGNQRRAPHRQQSLLIGGYKKGETRARIGCGTGVERVKVTQARQGGQLSAREVGVKEAGKGRGNVSSQRVGNVSKQRGSTYTKEMHDGTSKTAV